MIHPTTLSIRRTRAEWRVIACTIRTVQPELAAKITLARLADQLADTDSTLEITLTMAEHERLTIHLPAISWQSPPNQDDPLSGDLARAITDIESFLDWSPAA